MKTQINSALFGLVLGALAGSTAKSVTYFVSAKLTVRATWRHKPRKNSKREEAVVTFGAPNYLEQRFVKLCVKAKEPFPVKRLQFKAWPKKRKPKASSK